MIYKTIDIFLEHITYITYSIILFKQTMTETEIIRNLKFTISSLQSKLSDAQKEVDSYKSIQTQADNKIKTLTKLHNEKIKSLLNSLQILKKEKATVQNLSKQHKRSKLIEQLNKQILDQDIVIDAMRKYVYEDKGKEQGRKVLDELIVKTLTKGPERIRPATREELRMEIQKLKIQTDKGKVKLIQGKGNKQINDGNASEVSSISDRSFVNKNEEVYQKMRQLQNQNQNLKLEYASQGKIIQKLRGQVREKERLRGQLQLTVNELQVAGRKIVAFESILRENRQNMNKKIAELYERQLKVQQLQINNQQNGQRLSQANQTHNLMLEEMRQEKQELKMEIERLQKENQILMIENITNKKRQQQQKNKILQIRDINSKTKDQLSEKVGLYQKQTRRLLQQNESLMNEVNKATAQLFKEKGEWIQQKQSLLEDLKKYESSQSQFKADAAAQDELDKVRKQNRDLKELLQSGGGGSSVNNKVLLERLHQLEQMLEVYKTQDKSREKQLYQQLYAKHIDLLNEFEKIQNNSFVKKAKKLNHIELTQQQKDKLSDFSSGVSRMGLDEIDSAILDNFDSSYEYELHVHENAGKNYKEFKGITEEDRQLLKLINSDLWQFVKDDKVEKHIDQFLDADKKIEEAKDQEIQRRIKAIKNLSHPQGKKLVFYQPQLKDIDSMSDRVSVTSALDKQIDKYDSDVDISIKKAPKDAPNINISKLHTLSDDCSSQNVSIARSGDSSFANKPKKEKASMIKVDLSKSNGAYSASIAGSDMNSSVSSLGISEHALADIDSDISVDFRRKKPTQKR